MAVNIAIIVPIDIRRSSFCYRRRCHHPRDVSRLKNINSFAHYSARKEQPRRQRDS
jgi:hypothetical protein